MFNLFDKKILKQIVLFISIILMIIAVVIFINHVNKNKSTQILVETYDTEIITETVLTDNQAIITETAVISSEFSDIDSVFTDITKVSEDSSLPNQTQNSLTEISADNMKTDKITTNNETTNISEVTMPSNKISKKYVEGELICLAESEEKALVIAEQYGIELKKFQYGVATFKTDEDLSTVIKRGVDNGFPTLEYNYISQAFE